MSLPPSLAAALQSLTEGRSLKNLAADYATVSDRYRRLGAGGFQIASDGEALAYAIARLPATYGAVSDVLSRLTPAMSDFTPSSILDVGAGPGTAALAARALWPDASLHLVEPNAHLRAVAAHLLPDAGMEAATIQTATLPRSSLVLSSYVLNELSDAARASALSRLWDAALGALVIVEPGTPLGYAVILEARAFLLTQGTHIAAPCPHHLACPLAGSDRWCHFSARIPRTALHKAVKGGAEVGYEDEKFSYLVAVRTPVSHPAARVIGHPRGTKLVSLELCNANGTATTPTLSKRDPHYKQARRADWGDALDAPSE